jgi:hypothetical protein
MYEKIRHEFSFPLLSTRGYGVTMYTMVVVLPNMLFLEFYAKLVVNGQKKKNPHPYFYSFG